MAKKSATKKELPNEVKELIDHLRSTGTGESKLQKLAAISIHCESGEEFLLAAKSAVPDGTYQKIEEFVQEKQAQNKPTVATVEEMESVNTPPEEKDEGPQQAGLPTVDMKQPDALKAIAGNQFNMEQLELIIGFDIREKVKEAAKKRLELLIANS